MGLPKSMTLEEIKLMEIAGRITAETLTLVGKNIKVGITTLELDRIAEDYIRTKDATPSFKGYQGFEYSLCISIDEVVVHGIPSERKLEEGQIVSIDCGATYQGFVGDSAVTFPVGKISEEKQKLLKITEEALFKGIEQAIERNKVYDISRAIQTHCESNGYSLTRELTGHGIGKKMHLKPSIPNFVPPLLERRTMPNEKLINGIGLAIEPMVHLGKKEVYTGNDKWAVITRDHNPAAHFEHTVIVNGKEPLIMTLRD
jgi:methionyl aminopeptidase